jgi:CHAD domain-containing protein
LRAEFFSIPDPALPLLLQEGDFMPDFMITPFSSGKERRTFYDTFEWHAYEKKLAVAAKGNLLILCSLDSGLETGRIAFRGSPSAFFPSTLSPGAVKEELSRCSGIRAYLKLAMFDVQTAVWRILDENGKTTGFLDRETFTHPGNNEKRPFLSVCSVRPLKGYQEETETFAKMLAARFSFSEAFDFRVLFRLLMTASGRSIRGYSPKIDLQLDPDAPVHESARKLLLSSLSVMKANEEGVKKNIDTEFLHDFRVAMRRSRSLLRQLNGVFSPEDTERFLRGFSELGKRSNSLRDCDVYLLRKDAYFRCLPAFLQPHLDRFFIELETSRKRFHRQFCRYLDSEDYRDFYDSLSGFLASHELPDPEKAPEARLPTIDVASRGIRKAWKKVVRRGRLACSETTDEELHELRISCKKLRYLLEFFSSVYPHDTITPVVRMLRELQENLGTFVDYSVQVSFLQERLDSIEATEGSHLFAASIGGLIAILGMKKEETRAAFHKAFRSFDQEETRQQFRKLLEKEQ